MFEKIKKAIRRRETAKKRQEIEMALPWFKWHWFWQFGKEPMYGTGEITYKDWKWFKTLIEEGTIYDLKVDRCERLHGHIIYKHVSYRVADKERLDEVFKEHGWRDRKDGNKEASDV
jgi:hypothetical protein